MKPLEQSLRIFTVLQICPSDSAFSRWTKLRNISISILAFFFILFANVSSLAFVFNHLASDLENALYAVFQLSGFSEAIFTLGIAYLIRDDVKSIFAAFQTFHDSYDQKDKLGVMSKANERGKWMVETFIKSFVVICPISIFIECIGSAVYSQLKYDSIHVTSLFRPGKFELPWDQQTIWGWILEICFTVLNTMSCLFVNPAFLTLFISICEFHRAFYEMFRAQINEVGQNAEIGCHWKFYVKRSLFETIQFHISAVGLFHQTAKVYSSFILIQLTGSMVFLACSIFQMDLIIHNLDYTICIMVFAIAFGTLHLFLYCYHGKCATEYYFAFADCLFESNWMILPNDLQRTYVLMVAHAQKPLYYHGYGTVRLNLETFSKMLQTVIRYYLMFKTMTAKY